MHPSNSLLNGYCLWLVERSTCCTLRSLCFGIEFRPHWNDFSHIFPNLGWAQKSPELGHCAPFRLFLAFNLHELVVRHPSHYAHLSIISFYSGSVVKSGDLGS